MAKTGMDASLKAELYKRQADIVKGPASHRANGERLTSAGVEYARSMNILDDRNSNESKLADLYDMVPEATLPPGMYPVEVMRFALVGDPVPQMRHQQRVIKPKDKTKRPFASAYHPKGSNSARWRADMAMQLRCIRTLFTEQVPFSGAGAIQLDFLVLRPRGHYGTGRNREKLKASAPAFPITKTGGDFDNMAKAVVDEINGVCVDDDSQFVRGNVTKYFADLGATPGVKVRVFQWTKVQRCDSPFS